jgi:hypothetical protein
LEFVSAGDIRYATIRKEHYVVKKGNHGQQVHFLIWYKGKIAGIISGGSAVYGCAPRNDFFSMTSENTEKVINGIVDNTTFRLINHEKFLGSRVLSLWEQVTEAVWKELYGVYVFGFETFVVRTGLMREQINSDGTREVITVPDPEGHIRLGKMYEGAKWTYVGESAGSAKGHDGVGLTGGITGKGSFLRKKTPKKSIYCKWAYGHSAPIESIYESSWRVGAKLKKDDPKTGKKAGELVGTDEEQSKWRATKNLLTCKRKELIGKRFFRIQGKIERI